tara:strand:- start:40 stop:348 length:309 start_codon:yes stop_codon:yes gene_type:complete
MSLYSEQMESWLEFAFMEYTNNRSEYYQIQAQHRPGNAQNGSSKARALNTWATKTTHYSFNNYLCFRNWKKKNAGKWVRFYLHYTDAIPEMHKFFDYMEAIE